MNGYSEVALLVLDGQADELDNLAAQQVKDGSYSLEESESALASVAGMLLELQRPKVRVMQARLAVHAYPVHRPGIRGRKRFREVVDSSWADWRRVEGLSQRIGLSLEESLWLVATGEFLRQAHLRAGGTGVDLQKRWLEGTGFTDSQQHGPLYVDGGAL